MRRAGEDLVHRRRQWAEELAERAVVLELEAVLDSVVLRHCPLQLHAGLGEGEPIADRERQPERIGLDAPAVEDLRADREPHHPARHRHRLQPAFARHPVHSRARRREQVRTVVEPVLAARIRAHPTTQAIARLQQQDVAVAQPPRRRQPGDTAAHDDDIAPLSSACAHHAGEHRPRPRLG